MNLFKTDISKADILIVDDSPDNLRVLSTNLIDRGYEVRCVKSGAMALITAQASPPDLILLDIKMPGMDGYETCRCFKEDPQFCQIPIIFLSALDDPMDKVKAFEVGGEDYITKPFEIAEVIARVKHQLTIRKLRKELIEKNESLQKEIYERQQTATVLQDAKEAAEAANYAKSRFLARMSHELRTPLNSILGFTELMQNSSLLTLEHQEYVKTIQRSGQHLLKMINNILLITQAEKGHLLLDEHDFDLYSLLDRLETYWRLRAEYKNIQFIVEYDVNLPRYIHADESKLHHILNNLLENAVKFTPQGCINFWVGIDKNTANIQQKVTIHSTRSIQKIPIYFELKDTGIGITASELSSLFEVFSPTELRHKSNQGIGLGLPITRQLIQRMGGDISISSKPEKGTAVSFFIQVYLAGINNFTESIQDAGKFPEKLLDPVSFSSFTEQFYSDETITPDMLAAVMSAQWIKAIHLAAIKGFDRQILQLIQEIPPTHADLAAILRNWAENFWFEQIINITKPVTDLSH